jgi:cysteinyl-tRNA synthetase
MSVEIRDLFIHNSLSKKKEKFVPLEKGYIGMYVCGPTVYSDVHLGNVRTFVSFDVMYRHLLFLGYKIRYVRNITDVGHLLDNGEDRVSKRALLEKLEPMEIVQKYSNSFHAMMDVFNTHKPSIEPRATQHIIEQIEMVQKIIDNGYAYEKNGSVYFDTIKFHKEKQSYGQLSGRVIEELMVETRDDLKNQDEKNHPSDFAIWMKAAPEHIMKWNSPWSIGFPGWHLECSVMSTKYLGEKFDIHGGGNDLKFPHHENEVAQNVGACNCDPANYWLHTNMLLMNGRKMSKSDGNTISPYELFSGDSPHVTKGYTPMTVKFFMLQSHYSSTLDLTDGALIASEKGYKKLMTSLSTLEGLQTNGTSSELDASINEILEEFLVHMCDDFNTPRAIASLFELVTKINSLKEGHIDINQLSKEALDNLKMIYPQYISDVLGLANDMDSGDNDVLNGVMDLIIDLRQDARNEKNWAISDKIRDGLAKSNITIKDGKEGTSWNLS